MSFSQSYKIIAGRRPEKSAWVVKAITADGGQKVTAVHAATDHSWSDQRIFLEVTIINWLAGLKLPWGI